MSETSWEYLERFNAWRTGKDERTMEEAGIIPAAVTAAIREGAMETRRLKRQLQKAYADRASLHLQLRSLRAQIKARGALLD